MISDEKVRVRFVTQFKEYQITDTPFSLPSKLGRSGLSEVINHLLDLSESQPFDFMINDHLVRTPLQKFLAIHRVSTELIITIEYFPATSLSENSEGTEVQSWVGCVDASINGIVVAGCYDGTVKIVSSSDMSEEISTISAHEDPIRAMASWSSSSSSSSYLATCSKDQTVRCWDISSRKGEVHVATLSGHINSIESLGIWRPTTGVVSGKDTVLVSGDWAGTLFGWNVSQLSTDSKDAAAAGDVQDKKKRKKASDFMAVASSSVNTSMKPMFTIKAHGQAVSGISSSRANNGHNNSIFTCSWDHSLKEWDLERQDCVVTFASSKVITSVDCSTADNTSMLVATSHPDGRVRVWDPRQAGEASVAKVSLGKTTQWIAQAKWRPDSALVLSAADYAGNVALWDIRSSGVPLGVTEVHSGKALCVDWLTTGSGKDLSYQVVSGGSDCCVKATNVHQ